VGQFGEGQNPVINYGSTFSVGRSGQIGSRSCVSAWVSSKIISFKSINITVI